MSFDARTLCELRKRARLYDSTKERVKERISRNINVAVEKLKAVEKALLDDVDIEFGENPFLELLGSIESGSKHCTNEEVKAILEMSVSSDFGPDEDSFCALFKEIESFKDWEKRKRGKISCIDLIPQNIKCTSIRCNSMTLSWDDVKCECFYEIELKSLNGIKNIYHSFKPECTLQDLEPSTKYHIRVRIVKPGNSDLFIWSNPIVVRTESVFSNYDWKECPDFVDKERRYSVDEDNPRIATKIGSDEKYCTVIGNVPLPLSQVTSWSVKVLKSKGNDGRSINIGVAPTDINQNEDDNYKKCGWYFGCLFSELWSGPPYNYRNKEYGPRKGEGQYIHTGDIIRVILNPKRAELSFALNGANLGVAYEGIPLDKPLVPCVIFRMEGDSIELIV